MEAFNLATRQRALAEGARYFVLIDARDVTLAPAAVRQRLANMEKSLPPELAGTRVASAVMLSSAVIRGAITAMGWISPALLDGLTAVADFDDGIGALRRAAEAAGVPFPEHEVEPLRERIRGRG